jgi:hypothetical protein
MPFQNRSPFSFLLQVVLLAGFCSACGPGAESDAQYLAGKSDYDERSCAYSPSDGEMATRGAERSSRSQVGAFGKAYNPDWFTAVFNASISETLSFIEKTGVRVYRSEAFSSRSCKPFMTARELSPDLLQTWSERSRSLDGNSSGLLLAGIYLPKDPFLVSSPSLHDKAAIVLREDSDRWTLVHEFAHHNFTHVGGAQNHAMKLKRFLVLNERVTALFKGARSEEQRASEIAGFAEEYVELMDHVMTSFPLEEIAIETMLIDAFRAGQLRHVHPSAVDSAERYIDHSFSKTLALYRDFDEIFQAFWKIGVVTRNATLIESHGKYRRMQQRRVDELRLKINKAGLLSSVGDPSSWSSKYSELNVQKETRTKNGEAPLVRTCPHLQGLMIEMSRVVQDIRRHKSPH